LQSVVLKEKSGMAKKVQLKARARAGSGRGAAKRLRAEGVVPGVIYGAHTKPLNVAVAVEELEKVLHDATSENVLVDLQIEEGGTTKNRLALIQEVQHHPYEDVVLHIDFHEVLATEKLHTRVPVRPVGEPAGVKTGGGILEYVMRELHVECLPQDLPDVIEVNVEKLEIGQSIHIGDIAPPAGVALLDSKGQTVFLVVAPITEEELAAMTEAAAAPSAEPEVITAKGEEGEEGAVVEGEAAPKAEAGKAEAKAPAAGAAGKAPAAGAGGKAPAAGAPGKAPAGAAGKAPAGAAGKGDAKPAAKAAGKPEAKK
jgi:large subunit ribosomal protein L25